LAALPSGDDWVVAGSNGGHDQQPSWYLNLLAQPDAMITVGHRRVSVHARVAEGEARDREYRRFVDYLAVYAEYERATSRVIPVVFLEPTDT
jgi:deazaflavin-dependent oxidoreductase (nitroreductase family)